MSSRPPVWAWWWWLLVVAVAAVFVRRAAAIVEVPLTPGVLEPGVACPRAAPAHTRCGRPRRQNGPPRARGPPVVGCLLVRGRRQPVLSVSASTLSLSVSCRTHGPPSAAAQPCPTTGCPTSPAAVREQPRPWGCIDTPVVTDKEVPAVNEPLMACFVASADVAGGRFRPVIVGAAGRRWAGRRPVGRAPRTGARARIGSPLFVAPTTAGGEPMRGLRIPPPRQLELVCRPPDGPGPDADVWAGLPEAAREALLVLLARLIARGALDEEAAG